MICTRSNKILTNQGDALCQSEKFCNHTISIKRFSVRFLFLFKISTSAPAQHTTVVLIVLSVTTPGNPITERAKMDLEME